MRFVGTRLVVLGLALALVSCREQEEAAPAPIRPVHSVVAVSQAGEPLGFVGTVEPRYQSPLGFRVMGRMVKRDVNVGDSVKKEQTLAELDPLPFQLAVRSAQAEVSNALAQLKNATGAEERHRTLVKQGWSTESDLEAAERSHETAAAAVTQAKANLANAEEQLGYTRLKADFNGVVTALDAEIGQVVQPGQTVITIARPDVREAVIDVPDEITRSIRIGTRFDVALQLNPTVTTTGEVREIAPQADPSTRTRRIKIKLEDRNASFRIGTTVTAVLPTRANGDIELPLTALLERDGKAMVWVIDPETNQVSTQDVEVVARTEHSFRVSGGLTPGARVVTTGVNSLTPGQQVRLIDEASR